MVDGVVSGGRCRTLPDDVLSDIFGAFREEPAIQKFGIYDLGNVDGPDAVTLVNCLVDGEFGFVKALYENRIVGFKRQANH